MINITDKKHLEGIFAQDFGSPYFPILAELYLKEGDIRRAKLVCQIGLEHSSGNDCGKFILAKIALAEEKLTVAEKWLKQVVIDNPANFNAVRILIRLELILKRSPKTIMKYIQHILSYLPKDIECQNWLVNIADSSNELPNIKKLAKPKKIISPVANGAAVADLKHVKNIDYEVEESMATFTMLQVLKSQKYFHQALAVLQMLESKNMDADRISNERNEILSLMTQNTTE